MFLYVKIAMPSPEVVLVTGSSSGIGLETSFLLTREGYVTYASMRNVSRSEKVFEMLRQEYLNLKIIEMDVSDDKSVKDGITKIIESEGRIDIVINNAGIDTLGAVEDLSIQEYKEQFETNFYGVIRITKEILPIMREQRKGIIINVSSIGGRTGIPLNSAYSSSKFALEGFTESLRYEVKEYGIRVHLVEPGIVKTNFFENATISKNISKSIYKKLIQNLFEGFIPLLENNYSLPIQVAEKIIKIIKDNNSDFRNVIGRDAMAILEAKNKLSHEEFEVWMVESLFNKKGFVRKF